MSEDSLLYLIICGVGGVNFLFIGGYILKFSKKKKENVFLEVFLFSSGLAILSKCITGYENIFLENIKYWIWYIAFTIKGPVIFFYVQFLISNYKFKLRDIFHFLPFLVNIIFYFLTGESLSLFIFIMFIGVFFLYMAYLIYQVFSIDKINDKKIELNIVRNILITYTIIRFLELYLWFRFEIAIDAIVISILFYYFLIKEFKHNFFSDPPYRKEKYKSVKLEQTEINNNISKIKYYIFSKEIFLDPELTLKKMSEVTGIQPYIISTIINSLYGINFNEYINRHRIDKAKKILSDDKYSNLTIAYISNKCGFNSISSFNKYFLKNTNKTPSEFRKTFIAE